MMENLHPSTSIYSEIKMATSSPFNPYLASVSIMGNFGQLVEPPEGIWYFPLHGVLYLTNNFLQVMIHLMDESNHNMIHTITQHIGNVFTPLLENTTRSYRQLTHQMVGLLIFWGYHQHYQLQCLTFPRGSILRKTGLSRTIKGWKASTWS